MNPETVAIIIAVITGLTYIYRKDPILAINRTKQKNVLRIPGGQTPFLGDLLILLKNKDRYHDFLLDVGQKLQNSTFMIHLFGDRPAFVIGDPTLLEFVLKTSFETFEKGDEFRLIMGDLLGSGIFTSDGEHWKAQRKLAATIFNVKNFKDLVQNTFREEMVFFLSVLHEYSDTRTEFDLQDLFYKLTFDTFSTIAFGVKSNSVSVKGNSPFMVAFDAMQARNFTRTFNPFFQWTEYFTGEAAVNSSQRLLVRKFAKSVIDQHREKGLDGSDLLSLFMGLSDDKGNFPSDEELIDHVLNFMIAGRDTTATALSWTIFLLCKNPESLKSLLKEIGQVVSASNPTYDQIRNEMPYANAVFHEALRLFPSVPTNIRLSNKETTLPDGTFIPKGSAVIWSTYAMARNKAVWGANAKDFRPERWLEMKKQVSPFDYPVFHAGPRICLGKQMAELEGIFVLVEIVRRFKIEIVDETSVQYKVSIGLPMKNGLKVRVSERDI